MSGSIEYELPTTRDEIVASLASLDRQATELWRSFSTDDFFALPAGGGWSPAGNVEHLIKSVSPVTMALGLPRLVPWLLFGKAKSPSRSFAEVVSAYQAVLAAGGEAGSYGPRPKPAPADPAAAREQLLAKWQAAIPRLTATIGRWDERSLDRYRLPHPLLGKLTVREMLYFTLYHLGHHVRIVAARRAA